MAVEKCWLRYVRWSHYQVIPLHEPINISGAACGRFVVHPLRRSKSGFCKESVHQSIHPSINQSVSQSISQSINPSVCLSAYLSIDLQISCSHFADVVFIQLLSKSRNKLEKSPPFRLTTRSQSPQTLPPSFRCSRPGGCLSHQRPRARIGKWLRVSTKHDIELFCRICVSISISRDMYVGHT